MSNNLPCEQLSNRARISWTLLAGRIYDTVVADDSGLGAKRRVELPDSSKAELTMSFLRTCLASCSRPQF
jgi:hypothetical protein